MKLNKLFRLLVVGGAVMAGAQACGPVEEDGRGGASSNGAVSQPDGGASSSSSNGKGGGVDFW